jgi:hypothetical protein
MARLLLILPLIAALIWPAPGAGLVGGAPGVDAPAATADLEEEFEEEFEEVEREFEEECLDLEEGFEECEDAEADPTPSAGDTPPEECLLRTVRARARASNGRLQLIVRYTSSAAARVYVDFRLRSSRGAVNVGLVRRRLSKKGLIRLGRRLTDAELRRVRAANGGVVDLDVPTVPGYCRGFHHLTLRRDQHRRNVWLQAETGGGRVS